MRRDSHSSVEGIANNVTGRERRVGTAVTNRHHSHVETGRYFRQSVYPLPSATGFTSTDETSGEGDNLTTVHRSAPVIRHPRRALTTGKLSKRDG
ncbi:hypothetical protein [Haladaptatus sp. NG-WS-4]